MRNAIVKSVKYEFLVGRIGGQLVSEYNPFCALKTAKEGYALDDVMKLVREDTELISEEKVASINGMDGVDGWSILNEWRALGLAEGFGRVGPQMLVVKNVGLTASLIGVKPWKAIDLMRVRRNKSSMDIEYWYEFSPRSSTTSINCRKKVYGFEAEIFSPEHGVVHGIFACSRADYDKVVESLRDAPSVLLEGMLVSASIASKKEEEHFMIVQKYEVIEEDYSIADDVLSKLKSWEDLIPMRNYYTMEPLLDKGTMLAIMATVMYAVDREKVFNTIFFGESQGGKTSTIHFLVKRILNGSIESATASSGKAWMVSHKEGATPSKLFTEKTCVFVDEILKAVPSTTGQSAVHSYSVMIKNFMQKQMQMLDRTEVDAQSGNGIVTGKVKCAFIGAENDDDILKEALGRAYVLAEAVFARVQFGMAVPQISEDSSSVGIKDAEAKMVAYFCKKFGKNALKGIRALYLLSRNHLDVLAPVYWKKSMKEYAIRSFEARSNQFEWLKDIPFEYDVKRVNALFTKMVQINDSNSLMKACWASSAVLRGWEVCTSVETFKPVFDLRQQRLAETLYIYFIVNKVRILFPGIITQFELKGITRTGGLVDYGI